MSEDLKTFVYEHLPCWCDEAYKGRNLTDPQCPRCNFADDLVLALGEREDAAERRGFEAARELFGYSPYGFRFKDFSHYKARSEK
jgi:hypothetical protein